MSPAGSANTPEARARLEIDRQLEAAGWTLQHRDEMNLTAADAIAVREFKLHKGRVVPMEGGPCDLAWRRSREASE